MHDEDHLLPISALQHLLFCPRQCILIHIERLWEENLLTAEGRITPHFREMFGRNSAWSGREGVSVSGTNRIERLGSGG